MGDGNRRPPFLPLKESRDRRAWRRRGMRPCRRLPSPCSLLRGRVSSSLARAAELLGKRDNVREGVVGRLRVLAIRMLG